MREKLSRRVIHTAREEEDGRRLQGKARVSGIPLRKSKIQCVRRGDVAERRGGVLRASSPGVAPSLCALIGLCVRAMCGSLSELEQRMGVTCFVMRDEEGGGRGVRRGDKGKH